ncbi:hypothetical protein J007_04398 [Cryptococcus neoformans]|nr:hypothetical protein C356_04472 [Cryptococcus neoformans var. grubii c45]OXB35905.1 hypothetical protein J007_04398 [Cryptococcus neoformans var. grubii]OXC60058.1 hypothetical protein C358_04513 [Cryptococcus neoformans var. grubii MW-RSA852]
MLAVAHCLAVLSSSVRDDAKAACSRWRRQTRQSISECGTPFGQYVTSQLLNLLIPYFITYLQRCQTDCLSMTVPRKIPSTKKTTSTKATSKSSSSP